jgi:hypothetical protein
VPRRHLSAIIRGGAFVGLVTLCGVACSGSQSLNPVTGKVIHKNQPLAGALVTFHPKGSKDLKVERPTALTKEDGTFTVKTGQKDGAPAGDYLVTIICSVPVNKKAGKAISLGSDDDAADVLQGAYANVDTSKFPVTIKSGPNELQPFDLK